MKYRKKRFSLFFLSKSLATLKTRKDMDKMFTYWRGLLCYLVSHGYAKHLRERDTLKVPRSFYVRMSVIGTMEYAEKPNK